MNGQAIKFAWDTSGREIRRLLQRGRPPHAGKTSPNGLYRIIGLHPDPVIAQCANEVIRGLAVFVRYDGPSGESLNHWRVLSEAELAGWKITAEFAAEKAAQDAARDARMRALEIQKEIDNQNSSGDSGTGWDNCFNSLND